MLNGGNCTEAEKQPENSLEKKSQFKGTSNLIFPVRRGTRESKVTRDECELMSLLGKAKMLEAFLKFRGGGEDH